MIRKGNKRVHLYKGDYNPVRLYKGNKRIADYEKVSASGNSLNVESEYKPFDKLEVTGETTQETKDIRVMNVEGYALKYNNILKNRSSSVNGITFSFINGQINGSGIPTRSYANLSIISSELKSNSKYFVKNTTGISLDFLNANSRLIDGSKNKDFIIEIRSATENTFGFYPLVVGQEYNISGEIICVELTDAYGAGNEPTTLDQFYATPQGRLYHGYVEYGYHILGAGEYKSNQLALDLSNSKWVGRGTTKVLFENGILKCTPMTTNSNYGLTSNTYTFGTIGHKVYISVTAHTSGESVRIVYRYPKLLTEKSFTDIIETMEGIFTLNVIQQNSIMLQMYGGTLEITEVYIHDIKFIDLTDLGLDHLTLDELKSQRPDLFTYQPYHETETRTGLILSDGSVYPLSAPLYGIGDVKDKGGTNGVENRKFEKYVFTGNENWTSGGQTPTGLYRFYTFVSSDMKVASLNTGCSYGIHNKLPTYYGQYNQNNYECIRFGQNNNAIYIYLNENKTNVEIQNYIKDSKILYELATPIITHSQSIITDATIVNESYTETTESSPSPNFPSPVIGTEELTFGNETMELDLQEGDKVIVSHKVGKNLIDCHNATKANGTIYPFYLPKGKYTLTLINTGGQFYNFYLRDDTNTPHLIQTIWENNAGYSQTFEVDYDVTGYSFYFANNNTTCIIQIEQGTTATDYEPYLKDKVWEYKRMGKVDLGTLNWETYNHRNTYSFRSNTITDLKLSASVSDVGNIMSSKYKCISWGTLYNGDTVGVCIRNDSRVIMIHDASYPDTTTLQQSLIGTQFIYELAEPQWVDITDTELGQNLLNAKLNPNHITEISVNQGNVEIEYYKEK